LFFHRRLHAVQWDIYIYIEFYFLQIIHKLHIYLAGAEALNNALLAPAKQSVTTGGRKKEEREKDNPKTD
jgi:hypothetical protein